MRVLVFGINSSPDLTGIGKYTGEMNAFLVKQGHQVTMVTAHPYYPEWKLGSGYPRYFWKQEEVDGVRVYRCPLYIPSDPTAMKKVLHEISFLLSSAPVWLRLVFSRKYDYVLSINPPFHLTAFPLLYKWLRRAKLISHVQDLQVDVVKDMDLIKNGLFLNTMFSVERFLLRQSDWVSTISRGMERKIREKGIDKEKQFMFPNWVDCSFISPVPKLDSLRYRFELEQTDQIVLYSGNLGEKQGLEMIVELANQMRERVGLKFLIVGSGGAKARLEQMVTEYALDNVLFFPLQPYEDLPRLLGAADVHLVLQKKEASDLVMPSKLTGILSSGGLALITASPATTLHEVVTEYNMGVVVEPGSLDALQAGLEKCLEMGGKSSEIRNNARSYALRYLDKEAALGRFEKRLLAMREKK